MQIGATLGDTVEEGSGANLAGSQEVAGSIPVSSTIRFPSFPLIFELFSGFLFLA